MIRLRRVGKQSVHLAVDKVGASELCELARQCIEGNVVARLEVFYDTGLVSRKRGSIRSGYLSVMPGDDVLETVGSGVVLWKVENDALEHLVDMMEAYERTGCFESAEFWHVLCANRRDTDQIYLMDVVYDKLS